MSSTWTSQYLNGVRRQATWLCLLLTAGHGCDSGRLIRLGGGTDGAGGSSASGGADMSTAEASGGEGGLAGAGQGGDSFVPVLELIASEVTVLAEVVSADKDDNPTLTADELEICITSERDGDQGGSDIWCALRSSVAEPFAEPQPVTVLNDTGFESSAALALDGLSLWFGSERDDGMGGLDIFETRRASRQAEWNSPTRSVELSSESDDIPRPVAMANTVMPLGSRRGGDGYRTYWAERSSAGAVFNTPSELPELMFDSISVVDAFLSEDGQLLLYSWIDQESEDPADLYFSYRESTDLPFGPPQMVQGVNSSSDDRDPWLSVDGRRIYFSSDRSGDFEIYVAQLSWNFL